MKTIISRPDVAVIVLTRNAGVLWSRWLTGIQQQTVQAGRYLVIDSHSTDATVPQALAAGFEVYRLDPNDFNHGATRQLAAQLCSEARFLVYLTQDAILEQADSLASLLAHFADPEVGMAYGRHVPHEAASEIEKHARGFTYPSHSRTRTRQDLQDIGFRAAFSSDVYAIYRAAALHSVGGFPAHVIVSEDSYVSARLLMAGWKTVYSAHSEVRHSHHYSLLQVFRRYFDIGVFHATEAPMLQAIGKPDREAWVYVRSLIEHLALGHKYLLPWAALQTLIKLVGFRLGKQYQKLPASWVRRLSLQKAYWQQTQPVAHEIWVDSLVYQSHERRLEVPLLTRRGLSTVRPSLNKAHSSAL